MLEEQS
jgi:hypothetical protein